MRELEGLFCWHWLEWGHLSPHWSRGDTQLDYQLYFISSKTKWRSTRTSTKNPAAQPSTGYSCTQNWQIEESDLCLRNIHLDWSHSAAESFTERQDTVGYAWPGRLLQTDWCSGTSSLFVIQGNIFLQITFLFPLFNNSGFCFQLTEI